MSFWRTSPSAQEGLQGRRDQRSPRSLSGSGRYGPARVSGLSSLTTGSILEARLGGIATENQSNSTISPPYQHAGGGGLSHESGYPNLRISSQIALFRSPVIPTRQLTAVGFKIAALPVAYNDLSL